MNVPIKPQALLLARTFAAQSFSLRQAARKQYCKAQRKGLLRKRLSEQCGRQGASRRSERPKVESLAQRAVAAHN